MTATSAGIAEHLRSLEGYHYRAPDYYEVGREKIREYARAVQDRNPAHWSETAAEELGFHGLLAPHTFVSIPAMLANRRLFETVITDYEMYVQTEQVLEMYKPVLAGDKLMTDVALSSVRHVAGRDLLTITNTFSAGSGEVVQIIHTTVVGVSQEEVDSDTVLAADEVVMHAVNADARAVAAQSYADDANQGRVATALSSVVATRQPHTPDFDDVSVGDELPTHRAQLRRGDLVNYAGVSGDPNPIHWHEEVASLAQLPDVIAHGMLTIGLASGYVSSWLGDPAAITRFAARLSSVAAVGATAPGEIEFSGRVKSMNTDSRTARIIVTAESGGKKIFGLATADVRLR